jgi:uncharacterized protein (TIGR03086 family)
MSEVSERFRAVAEGFSARTKAVPVERWDDPSPCEKWKARDVVAHLVTSTGMFLARVGVELPEGPSADDDPVGAWETARAAAQAALDDPSIAGREYDGGMGRMTLEATVGMFGIGDVLVHTWDLARATGLDERLDADEVHRLLVVMEPNDAMMRQGTAFGPKVSCPDDADEQTKLLAFTGRHVLG